jgi:hypothetical protein
VSSMKGEEAMTTFELVEHGRKGGRQ